MRWLRSHFWPVLLAVSPLAGCTGLTLGVHAAGADAHVGSGEIAVDAVTETTFVVSQRGSGPGERSVLHAIRADADEAVEVDEAPPYRDARILFPTGGVLLMREVGGGEALTLFDRQSLEPKTARHTAARYAGTRMSPSHRWIAVADNASPELPIHVLDGETLEAHPVPHGGRWLEAMWMNHGEELVTAIFSSEPRGLRIAGFPMESVVGDGFATDATGAWARPVFDVAVPGKTGDLCFSFTWVAVSPDDRWVVVPVRDVVSQRRELVVVDVPQRSYRIVPGAKGPVGFTADGSTIVSYAAVHEDADCVAGGDSPRVLSEHAGPAESPAPESGDRMLLIDTASLGTRSVEVPGIERFNFHVMGSLVLVAPAFERPGASPHPPLFLFDAATTEPGHSLGAGRIHLDEIVSREAERDVFAVSHGAIAHIELASRRVERIDVGFEARHVNYLPRRRWLALDDRTTAPGRVVFWDTEGRRIARTVSLRPAAHWQ